MTDITYEYTTASEIDTFIASEYEDTDCQYSEAILIPGNYDDNPNVLVAKRGKDILGFALTAKDRPDHLNTLYVKESERRLGIAKQLVNQLKIESLGCISENKTALAFYTSLGFDTVCHGQYLDILQREL